MNLPWHVYLAFPAMGLKKLTAAFLSKADAESYQRSRQYPESYRLEEITGEYAVDTTKPQEQQS